MKVLVFNQQSDLILATKSVKPIVLEVLKQENRITDEVAIHFVSKEEISSLHLNFFDDPTPTDCISFPMDSEENSYYHVLGEIFICPKIAIEYVNKNNGDPYIEVTLYLVHGLLHLLGYDDLKKAEKIKMRAAESRHMEHLVQMNSLIRKSALRKK